MLSPLRHIELAIQREYELLTKYERQKVGHLFHLAREELRDASDTLAGIRENRNKRIVKIKLG